MGRKKRKFYLPLPVLGLLLVGIAIVAQAAWLGATAIAANDEDTNLLLNLKSEILYRTILDRQEERTEPPLELFSPHWGRVESKVVRLARQQNFRVAVYIKDLKNGRLIRFNDREPMPSASLVKLPIMMAVFHELATARLDYEDQLVLRQYLKVGGSGNIRSLPSGTGLSVRRLLREMIINSDNTATNMLVARVGMNKVNNVCDQFGMVQTDLIRGVMDLRSRDRGIENISL